MFSWKNGTLDDLLYQAERERAECYHSDAIRQVIKIYQDFNAKPWISSIFLPLSFSQTALPSGNQTWLAGKSPINGGFAGNIIPFYGGFSSKPCLIIRGYQVDKPEILYDQWRSHPSETRMTLRSSGTRVSVFFHILRISSSQLTKSYVSEG